MSGWPWMAHSSRAALLAAVLAGSSMHAAAQEVGEIGAFAPSPDPADCITDAARYHGVSPPVLRAILWHESRFKAHAVGKNPNGTVDVGIAQINSMHFERPRGKGITPQDLKDACVGSYVAAWHLRQQINTYGNTWFAVGAYHSRTPHFNGCYANSIHHYLVRWKAIAPGARPFPEYPQPCIWTQVAGKGSGSATSKAGKAGSRVDMNAVARSVRATPRPGLDEAATSSVVIANRSTAGSER
jgi:soluble lytic murein transglycosylase-like protein